jgi:hypothetical protein
MESDIDIFKRNLKLKKTYEVMPINILNNKIGIEKIDKNNNNVDPYDFQCCVCLNLVLAPKSCSKCEKLFCSDCLEKCLQYDLKCVHCREKFLIKNLTRIELKILNKFQINCPIPYCHEKFYYEQFQNHLMNCKNFPIQIKCLYCQNIINDFLSHVNFNKHLLTCLYNILNCENSGCNELFLRKSKSAHEETCNYRQVSCEGCYIKYQYTYYVNGHSRKECRENIINELKSKYIFYEKVNYSETKNNKEEIKIKNKNITILIKNYGRISVFRDTSISTLRINVDELCGFKNYILKFGNKWLNDFLKLNDYNIHNNDSVELLIFNS